MDAVDERHLHPVLTGKQPDVFVFSQNGFPRLRCVIICRLSRLKLHCRGGTDVLTERYGITVSFRGIITVANIVGVDILLNLRS